MMVKAMPMVYVSDVDAAVAFYEALGFPVRHRSRPGVWVELDADGAILALHGTPTPPPANHPLRVELSMEAQKPLEEILGDLRSAGVVANGDVEPIIDEDFGRSVGVRDPEGLRIQINEHDRTLYT